MEKGFLGFFIFPTYRNSNDDFKTSPTGSAKRSGRPPTDPTFRFVIVEIHLAEILPFVLSLILLLILLILLVFIVFGRRLRFELSRAVGFDLSTAAAGLVHQQVDEPAGRTDLVVVRAVTALGTQRLPSAASRKRALSRLDVIV